MSEVNKIQVQCTDQSCITREERKIRKENIKTRPNCPKEGRNQQIRKQTKSYKQSDLKTFRKI